jgi:DNA polymerase-3 subunit alpha
VKYVSLHSHSTYSYMDGFGLPEHHVERVAELGMTALALTEHGNVSSHVKLEQAAQKHGIKPIFGLEAYCAPSDMRETQNARKWHMTMLAMNQSGYQNLMRMVTRSWSSEGFYRWPTVLGANLKENQEGIICTSGCADSHLACTLLGGKGIEVGDYDAAVKVLKGYKRMLGDRYYLEVQRFPGLERSRILNQQYAIWSAEFGIPLVATSDVHYPRPHQNEMQKILHAAGRNTGTVAAAEAGWEYDILLTYPESDAEIRDDLIKTGLTKKEAEAAIDNTAIIAERCNVVLPKMDRIRYPGTRRDMEPWAPPRQRLKK